MKFRTDFVTNSSSSSFILGFTSKDNIETELLNKATSESSKLLNTVVLKDVLEAEQFDAEEVEKRIRDNYSIRAKWYIEDLYRRKTNCSYLESRDYVDTDEGKKEVEQFIQNIVNDVLEQIYFKELKVFVEVSYSDHCDSELEHHIMPNIPVTLVTFNHH